MNKLPLSIWINRLVMDIEILLQDYPMTEADTILNCDVRLLKRTLEDFYKQYPQKP